MWSMYRFIIYVVFFDIVLGLMMPANKKTTRFQPELVESGEGSTPPPHPPATKIVLPPLGVTVTHQEHDKSLQMYIQNTCHRLRCLITHGHPHIRRPI